MSHHSYFILNLLNLKDNNIYFDDNFLSVEVINNVESKVFHAKLSYTPIACYNCDYVFDSNVIKYSFKSSRIKRPSVSGFNAYLILRKQCYFCKHCNSTFILNTNIVNKNCFISNNTKLSIALSAKDKLSEEDITKNYSVSHSTVNRVIDSCYLNYKPNFNYLPSF